MHNSFTNVAENRYDRHFGGTSAGVADPYISGYHFIDFKQLPSQLASVMQNDIDDLGIASINDAKRLLSGSCVGVTPPGGTMNKAEFTGLGGTKYAVPTNMDYGNTISMRFVEFSRLPILHIFHSWFRLMRDYRMGVSPLGTGDLYTKSNYAASLLYWTTDPSGKKVEYSAFYTGVFPTKDPQDSFTGDVATNDKLEIEIEFNVDRVWKEAWVREEAQRRANSFHSSGISVHGLAPPTGLTDLVGDHTDDVTVN